MKSSYLTQGTSMIFLPVEYEILLLRKQLFKSKVEFWIYRYLNSVVENEK